MAIARQKKIQPRLLLDNGMDSEGNIKTVTINLNGIVNTVDLDDNGDVTFILSYASLIEPCLNKEINSVQAVSYNEITES